MSCREFRQISDRYWLGEATPAEVDDFNRHVARCEVCQASFEHHFKELEHALRTANIPDPSVHLKANIMRAVRSLPTPARRRPFWQELAAMGAMLLTSVLAGTPIDTFIGQLLGETPGTGQSLALNLPLWALACLLTCALVLNTLWLRKETVDHGA